MITFLDVRTVQSAGHVPEDLHIVFTQLHATYTLDGWKHSN